MYRYDIFVSYKREPKDNRLVTPWLREVLRRIEFWLKQETGGHKLSFFFDEDSIDVGSEWPVALRRAVADSKCLLPIWAPDYFRSKWCTGEWQTFVARQQALRSAGAQGCELIFPVKYYDGLWFPQEAQDTEQLDLSDFTATTEAFWKTSQALELERAIKRFVPTVAAGLLGAPDHDPTWPIVLGEPVPPPVNAKMARM